MLKKLWIVILVCTMLSGSNQLYSMQDPKNPPIKCSMLYPLSLAEFKDIFVKPLDACTSLRFVSTLIDGHPVVCLIGADGALESVGVVIKYDAETRVCMTMCTHRASSLLDKFSKVERNFLFQQKLVPQFHLNHMARTRTTQYGFTFVYDKGLSSYDIDMQFLGGGMSDCWHSFYKIIQLCLATKKRDKKQTLTLLTDPAIVRFGATIMWSHLVDLTSSLSLFSKL